MYGIIRLTFEDAKRFGALLVALLLPIACGTDALPKDLTLSGARRNSRGCELCAYRLSAL